VRLAVALAGSLALHAATLALPGGAAGAGEVRTAATPAPVSLIGSFSAAVAAVPPAEQAAGQTPAIRPLDTSAAAPAAADARHENAVRIAAPEAVGPAAIPPPYFPADALTRMPEALTAFDPLLPDRQLAPPDGRLELRVWLSADGLVDRVEVMKTEVPQPIAAAAVDAFRQMRFRPGEIRGTPVGSSSEVTIGFATAPPAAAPGANPPSAR
jgi:hypothetical protein